MAFFCFECLIFLFSLRFQIFLLQESGETKKGNIERCRATLDKVTQLPGQRTEVLGFCQFLQTKATMTSSGALYALNTLAVEQLEKLEQGLAEGDNIPRHEVLLTKGLCLMSSGAEKFEDKKKKEGRVSLQTAVSLIESAVDLYKNSPKPANATMAQLLCSVLLFIISYFLSFLQAPSSLISLLNSGARHLSITPTLNRRRTRRKRTPRLWRRLRRRWPWTRRQYPGPLLSLLLILRATTTRRATRRMQVTKNKTCVCLKERKKQPNKKTKQKNKNKLNFNLAQK